MIKFALLGCGRIAARHAEHIKKNGQLAAVCDTEKDKADAFAEKYKCRAYYNVDDLLEKEKKIDVVSVCTPNGLHAEHTIKSFRAGRHVLCEKPMAINVHDCGEMIKEAEKANKRLFVVKQNRFNPPIEALKDAIDKGHMGRIMNVQLNCYWNRRNQYYTESTWKGSRKLDGGTLFTQFSHFIDLLYWMVGDVQDIKAYTDNMMHDEVIEFEDSGVVLLKFFNGAMGTVNFTVNSFGKNMEGSLTIFGEKGTVKVGGQYLNELEYQNIEGYKIEGLAEGKPANQYGQYIGSMSNHDRVYENVRDVLKNSGIIATNGFEGLKTVEIISRIYMAAEGGR